MMAVFAIAMIGAVSIALLPRDEPLMIERSKAAQTLR